MQSGDDGIFILDEKSGEEFEPTQEEIENYAEWLGMDKVEHKELFWIIAICCTVTPDSSFLRPSFCKR